MYPLSGGVAEGRGGFPQAYRRSRTHPAATRHPSEEGMESGYHSLCQQTQKECSVNAPIPNNRFAAKEERGYPDRACCRTETRPPSGSIDLSHREG